MKDNYTILNEVFKLPRVKCRSNFPNGKYWSEIQQWKKKFKKGP